MIIPIVDESEWAGLLSGLPSWAPDDRPMVIVAPHPDDETLGAGGLIAHQRSRGIDVIVAAVTDGENAYPGTAGLSDIRRVEQIRALERLGVSREKIARFEFPDSDVASHEQALIERLSGLVFQGTHVVAPWNGDFHPDHEVCGRAAKEVSRRVGATLTGYFFWTWHFGTPATITHLPLVRFPLNRELLLAKTDALLHHESQLGSGFGEPILPESLLAPARRNFETFVTG